MFMRIRLCKGKQRELIFLAKGERTWIDLAKSLGLNEFYIRHELRNEKRTLSEEVFKRLSDIAGVDFGEFVLERLEDNWGRIKGGKISEGRTIRDIVFPKYSKEFAEFYGVMLGDGNSNRTKGVGIGTYMIRVIGDLNLDREYHINYLKPLMENLFGLKVKVGRNKNNAMHLTIHSKLVVEFLEKQEFPPGDKIRNEVSIPSWIKDNRDYLCACLRGIYDTDGGIYQLNNQTTCQIAFTNHNKKLLKDVRDSLIKLGIVPSKIVAGRRVYITKKSELQKFLKLIGFSNLRHSKKIEMFNLVP
jgi:hypothetical protein